MGYFTDPHWLKGRDSRKISRWVQHYLAQIQSDWQLQVDKLWLLEHKILENQRNKEHPWLLRAAELIGERHCLHMPWLWIKRLKRDHGNSKSWKTLASWKSKGLRRKQERHGLSIKLWWWDSWCYLLHERFTNIFNRHKSVVLCYWVVGLIFKDMDTWFQRVFDGGKTRGYRLLRWYFSRWSQSRLWLTKW